uniref:MSP domain-containing protein n=1 Tax=Panagrellus redivivus TaxID=6233 RepID=A0A7E4V191_PANRE
MPHAKPPARSVSYQGSYIEWPVADDEDDIIYCRSAVGGFKRKPKNVKVMSASSTKLEIPPELTISEPAKTSKKRGQTRGARQSEQKVADLFTGPPRLDRCDTVGSMATVSTAYDDDLMEDLPPPLSPIEKPAPLETMPSKSNIWSEIKSGTYASSASAPKSSTKYEVPSWTDKLAKNYGDPEIAKTRPWLTDEQNAMLKTLDPDKKMRGKFVVYNYNEELKAYPERPMFDLPSPEQVVEEQHETLKYINNTIALYRTMIRNSAHPRPSGVKEQPLKPLFLPFLRRNLRYNKYLPEKITTKIQMTANKKVQFEDLSMEETSSETTNDSNDGILPCSQDIIVKLVSIRHNLLPAGYHASVTFYYTFRNPRTNKFTKVRKIASSTVTIEVKDDLIPVLIDMPSDCEFSEADAKEIYIILRVVFFEEPQEVPAGRSLRSVPARIAGQCERAREAQENSKNRGVDKCNTETAMLGTYKITERDPEWVCHGGTTSIILVDEDKLNASLNGRSWQSDGSMVLKVVSLAKKFHTNPFVHLNVKSADDDETTVKSANAKRRKSNPSDGVLVPYTYEMVDEFQYEIPPYMIYQLELDMFRKPPKDNRHSVPCHRGRGRGRGGRGIHVGVGRPRIPRDTPTNDQQTGHSSKPTKAEQIIKSDHNLQEALAECDARAPPPKKFAYKLAKKPRNCVFCEVYHPNLFALMWHLKTCHSRFSYVYRSAIEYKPGHYCPGIVMKVAPPEEDVYWHNRKVTMWYMNDLVWPRQYSLSDSFVTPCNTLFKEITDGLIDVMPKHEYDEFINKEGPRPLHNQYTVTGRVDVKVPEWTHQKMVRDINEITDLDFLETKFYMMWNKFTCENGRPSGREFNYYRLCRMFVEQNREAIQEENVVMPMMTLFVYFKTENMINEDEFYDINMRMNRDYDAETDIMHPIQEHHRERAERGILRAERKANRKASTRPKKEPKCAPTTRVLRSNTSSSSRDNMSSQPHGVSSMDSIASSNADNQPLSSSESLDDIELPKPKRPRFIVGDNASLDATPSSSREISVATCSRDGSVVPEPSACK